MKYVRQFLIIMAVTFAGELLNGLIPLPIPASIYGLVILFVCLCSGWIPLEKVKDTGRFLVEIMPLMFIPAAVGLLQSWSVLRPIWLPVAAVVVISTVAVMAAAGWTSQLIITRDRQREAKEVADCEQCE